MTNTNFNTSNSTFRQLMGNGLTYAVPRFQRDYSWGAEEWEDLWQDIVALFDTDPEPSHYMGYLVLQSSDSKRFDIIDGQQRLTTLSVLILAAISRLQSLADSGDGNNARRADQLRNSYIGYLDPVTLIPQSKLRLNRHNESFYQNYLVPLTKIPQRGLTASEKLLRAAFQSFSSRVTQRLGEDGEALARFVDTMVDKLFFTVITVTDELNAFKVFETLNSRGVRLSSTDLLKNYLFSLVDSSGPHEAEVKNLEERWEGIVGALENESFPDFLRVYWNSANKFVRKSDLFKRVRGEVRDVGEAFGLIRRLDEAANVYRGLRHPVDHFWDREERRYIQELRMFNVRQPLSLLLAAYARFGEESRQEFGRVLRAVSIVSFRYNVICNRLTYEQERVYNTIALRIATGEFSSARDVIRALEPVYPDDASFAASFGEKELRTTSGRNRKVVRYILSGLENRLSGVDVDQESSAVSVEHVLPVGAGDDWGEFSDSEVDRLVFRLGNMTLMRAGMNRDAGIAGYEQKRKLYAQSEFVLTAKMAQDYDEWTADKVHARQSWMAKQATAIWRLDL